MKTKDEDAALRALLDSISSDVLTPHVSDDDVAAEIRREGGDPDAIGERGKNAAQALLALRRIEQPARWAALRTTKAPMSPKQQLLLAEIEAGKSDRRFAELLETRAFDADEATEDELWELLGLLRELRSKPSDK
jgi:hypothetical protein